MTEAKFSLARKSPERHAFQVMCMARYRARQIIAEQYRWAGRKLASVGVRQWHADTEAYFQAHRAELIA